MVEPDLDGKPQMRADARAKVAEQLSPIAAANRQLADKLETLTALKVEFLAGKLPKKPDILGLQIGTDRWKPSDFEMRKWARYVAGVEDPGGIEERLASGQVSLEDREVMQKVYPERLAEITRQIMEGLPAVTKLSHERKLALSILTGVAVVPSMDPRIRAVLQGTYADQTPPEGGPPGPVAQANFGSVTKSAPEPTPAQSRSS